VSLFLLLFGTLCGDFALLHDAALRAVAKLWLGDPPGMAPVIRVKDDVADGIYVTNATHVRVCAGAQVGCWLQMAESYSVFWR
jgi:hypothetical protein